MKVFPSLFSKSDRRSNARSVGRLRRGGTPFSAFLFCQAQGGACAPGGAKRSQFSFVPLVSKKKADIKFKFALLHKGNPPLVRFPSAELGLGIHPSVALWKDKGVSPLRRRPTLRALDQRSLLGKRRKTFSNRQRRKVPDKLQFINS